MKLPIKPIIKTISKDEVYIRFEFPDWTIKSLLKWIFTKEVLYTQYYECWYKLLEMPDSRR